MKFRVTWFIVCAVLYATSSAYSGVGSTSLLHPILIVPGDGGSQIEARLNRSKSVHWWCANNADWYDLWLNIEQMVPVAVDCWEENIKLQYNFADHSTSNSDGVETRIPGFGTTFPVEYLDKSKRDVGIYFADIVNKLVDQGYVRDKNIRGAPYDFRKAAHEQKEYFIQVKILIEEMYRKNGNIKVVLLTHSMGSIMMLHFLHSQTQRWKDQYLRSFVSLAGVWGGTVDSVKVFAMGDNLGSRFLSAKNLLWEQTCPSLAWLLPSRDFWGEEEIFVSTPDKNFTRSDLPEFFNAVSPRLGPAFQAMANDTKDILAGLEAPRVELHCIHSTKVPTIERLNYRPGYYPAYDPDLVTGDGDGTVNIRSLEACLKWKTEQEQPVFHKKFQGLSHLGMLRAATLIEHVAHVVADINKPLNTPHHVQIDVV